MGKHHTEICAYRIFALIHDEDFFIGKTASPRISAVYSRHRCGKVAATRETMDLEIAPSLYILEDLKCTGAEAHQHILAWICRFEEAGYCTINHTRTAIASETLYPPTEAIFRRIMQEPMEQILARTYVPKPSEADRKSAKIQQIFEKKEKPVQMNLRIHPKDKRIFDQFCKSNHLKSREALGLMLDQITKEDDHLYPLLAERTALIQENEQMKNQLPVFGGDAFLSREQNSLIYLSFLKAGLLEYLEEIFPKPEEKPLPTYSYKRFKTVPGMCMEYPEAEGFLVIQAVAMLWGRNKSRFIVGSGPRGKYLKLRYYPKSLYMGPRIWEYPPGTRWFVGCRRATDGAMEVVAALPLPPEGIQPKASAAKVDSRPSLDDQIYNAATKK